MAALTLSACGGDDEKSSEPGSGAAAKTSVVTMSEREFRPSEVIAAAGEPIAVHNGGSVGHDLKLRRDGEPVGGTQVVNPGETQQLQVLFDPGDYEMYCSVPGHEESGMKGTFSVVE
jgi:plastocyanin